MNLELELQRPLGSFVAERPSRARVFERFGLDYCCGGKRPLFDACTEKGVDAHEVLRELFEEDHNEDKVRRIAEHFDWSKASLTDLANHIEHTHHKYMRQELPRIVELSRKVATRHGDSRPSLRDLAECIGAFSEQMLLST